MPRLEWGSNAGPRARQSSYGNKTETGNGHNKAKRRRQDRSGGPHEDCSGNKSVSHRGDNRERQAEIRGYLQRMLRHRSAVKRPLTAAPAATASSLARRASAEQRVTCAQSGERGHPMSIEALWIVEFRPGLRLAKFVVAVIETGRVLGGNSHYYYVGKVSLHDRRIEADIEVAHHHGDAYTIFATEERQFRVTISGQVSPDFQVMEGTMHHVAAPERRVAIRLRRAAELLSFDVSRPQAGAVQRPSARGSWGGSHSCRRSRRLGASAASKPRGSVRRGKSRLSDH